MPRDFIGHKQYCHILDASIGPKGSYGRPPYLYKDMSSYICSSSPRHCRRCWDQQLLTSVQWRPWTSNGVCILIMPLVAWDQSLAGKKLDWSLMLINVQRWCHYLSCCQHGSVRFQVLLCLLCTRPLISNGSSHSIKLQRVCLGLAPSLYIPSYSYVVYRYDKAYWNNW